MIFCGRAPLEARDFVLYLEHLSEACPAGVLRRAPVDGRIYATNAAMPATGLKTIPGKSV